MKEGASKYGLPGTAVLVPSLRHLSGTVPACTSSSTAVCEVADVVEGSSTTLRHSQQPRPICAALRGLVSWSGCPADDPVPRPVQTLNLGRLVVVVGADGFSAGYFIAFDDSSTRADQGRADMRAGGAGQLLAAVAPSEPFAKRHGPTPDQRHDDDARSGGCWDHRRRAKVRRGSTPGHRHEESERASRARRRAGGGGIDLPARKIRRGATRPGRCDGGNTCRIRKTPVCGGSLGNPWLASSAARSSTQIR